MTVFKMYQLLWATTTKIFRSLSGCMLLHTPFNIVGNAGIKRVVTTKNNINQPVICFICHQHQLA